MAEVDVGEVWRAPVVATVNDGALRDRALNEGGQGAKGFGKVEMGSEGAFDFEGAQALTFADEEVDFIAFGVAIEKRFGQGVAEGESLEELRNDDVFKKPTKGRMGLSLSGVGNTEERSGEAWFSEVDFRGAGEAAAEVGVVRAKAEDDVRGLKDGKPLIKGVGGDTDVVGQGTEVKKLPHTPGKEAHEGEEAALLAQVDEAADVAFHVSLVVGLIEARGGKSGLLVEQWHETAPNGLTA